MDNALLVGLSRQTTLQRSLDIIANNIANANTTGFKADQPAFAEFLNSGAVSHEFKGGDGRISYVIDRTSWTDLRSGSIQQTGNPLDVALEGDAMLAVQTPRGERYTRSGALQINAGNELVTADGARVLGDGGPIAFQQGDRNVSIGRDGTVSAVTNAGPQLRGKLRLVTFPTDSRLQKDGNNTFAAPDGTRPQPAPNPGVVQGAIEKSNVQPVIEITRMMEANRIYGAIAQINQAQTDLHSIDRLAEVPA